MSGKIDPSFRSVLEQLDGYQAHEAISPYLAETFRRMVFDSVTDDPKWLNALISELRMRAIPLGSRYIATQMKVEDGYRLTKAAEHVAQVSGGFTNTGKILAEYWEWHNKDDEELR